MGKVGKTMESWQERRKRIRYRWAVPFVYAEWRCEQLSHLLEQWAFLDILGHIGRFTILIAVITYFMGADERRTQAENQRKSKHYQAWQVLSAAYGKPGGGGRRDALQDLNGDRVSLAGINVSDAKLPGLDLHDAHLRDANFFEADLYEADFSNAHLMMANLSEAQLGNANLSRAYLRDANLSGAKLTHAKLIGAHLLFANLSNAVLLAADLSSAELTAANLVGALLRGTNLSGAYLTDANLQDANLSGSNLSDIKNWQHIKNIDSANIYDVTNAPAGFVEWAIEHGAVRIEDGEEWNKLIQKKMKERMKRETGTDREDQKKTR